jgi:hypothetical protein
LSLALREFLHYRFANLRDRPKNENILLEPFSGQFKGEKKHFPHNVFTKKRQQCNIVLGGEVFKLLPDFSLFMGAVEPNPHEKRGMSVNCW